MEKMGKVQKTFKIFLLFLSILIILLFVFFITLSRKYSRWEDNILKSSSALVCLDDIYTEKNMAEIESEIEQKVEKFILSDSRTDFVVLDQQEVLHILANNIQEQPYFDLQNICLSSSVGLWHIYTRYDIRPLSSKKVIFSSLWIVMDIVKDNRETPEIYVKEIRVGDIKLPEIFTKNIIVEINKGMTDATILLNENRFLGRRIENIELLEGKVVFKGTI